MTLLLASSRCLAAISYNSGNSGFVNGGTSKTITHTLGTGDNRIVVVMTDTENGGVVTSVTYNGVAMTFFNVATQGGNKSELWYMLNASLPAAGTYNVVATWTTSAVSFVGAASFFGVSQAAPEVSKTNQATADPITTTITTLTNNAWVVDTVSGSDLGTWSETGSANPTEIFDLQAGSTASAVGAYEGPVTPAGNLTHVWQPTDVSTARLTHCMMSLAPAETTSTDYLYDATIYDGTLY